MDNIFIDRLCHTLEYKCVSLHQWNWRSGANFGPEMDGVHNHRRPRKAFGGCPPAVASLLQIEVTQPDQQE
ncbi:MAG: hypothetical protein FJX25_18200 [Alphaproteobacteria bacterium]|nr:hypothetical protein [Alphaproteobacteria bacterium]